MPRSLPGDDAMAEIVTAIGAAAATKLAHSFGGTTIYVPRVAGDHHPICVAIGREAADLLIAWARGSDLAVPKQAARRAQVRELRRSTNLTIPQIALQTSYSERTVYRLLREQADDRQASLFDDPD